jgi:cytochrome c556
VMMIGVSTTMALAIALMLTATTNVWADDARKVVDARQEKFNTLGRTAKALEHELGRKAPDRAAVFKDATTIADLAAELRSWFPPGSGPEAVRTAAKADIWAKPADFRKAEDSFVSIAHQFAQISTSDDLTYVRQQAKVLSETCGDCHDAFRSRLGLFLHW